MGNFLEWVTSDPHRQFKCIKCAYKGATKEYLEKHISTYRLEEQNMILYMNCDGSIEGRNKLNNSIDFKWMDCTDGQAAYQDGDIKEFGKQLVEAAQKRDVKLYCVMRISDHGLGLIISPWQIQGGLDAGVFEKYDIPP